MYLKNIFSFLTLSLLTLVKVNGNVSQCEEISLYFQSRRRSNNFRSCKQNDNGEVIELSFVPLCLENEEFATALSYTYKTIESLHLVNPYMDWNLRQFCTTGPTNYEALSNLTNLKFLQIDFMENLNVDNLFANIPDSVEHLEIGQMIFNQEIVDSLSNLTNLNSIIMNQVKLGDELDFSKFENLKNLTSFEYYNVLGLNMFWDPSGLHHKVQGNMLKYCRYLKKLKIYRGHFDKNSLYGLGDLTELEELIIDAPTFADNVNFSSINKDLKNLTFLKIGLPRDFSSNPSPTPYNRIYGSMLNHFPSLKKLIIYSGSFDKDSLSALGNLIELEELILNFPIIENENNLLILEELKELKNLTSLSIQCQYPLNNISSNFFYLTNLKRLSIFTCQTTFNTSSDNSLTWANLNNLEFLDVEGCGPNTFELENIGDLSSLKEVHLMKNDYSSIPECIGNLKNLEILNISNNLINSLPESIGNLKNLKILDISNNSINSLPKSIENLKNLEIVRDPKYSDNLVPPYVPHYELIDNIEPSDDVEPSDNIEPSDDVEFFDYDEIFDYA